MCGCYKLHKGVTGRSEKLKKLQSIQKAQSIKKSSKSASKVDSSGKNMPKIRSLQARIK